MLSDLARQQALTMFYANEAYQSGGPFKHVVWAGQAVETDVKAEVNKAGPATWDGFAGGTETPGRRGADQAS